jgi:hypothetical protein
LIPRILASLNGKELYRKVSYSGTPERGKRMKKRKRKIIGTMRIAAPHSSVTREPDEEQDEFYKLMKPLFTAMAPYNPSGTKDVLAHWEEESSGILAWGVRSGYLLWARMNPGKIPTFEQAAMWFEKGKKPS